MDAETWTLVVDGEVERPQTFTISQLKQQFDVVKLQLQLECGGNGRASFNPPARGNQWTIGAVGNAEWTGIRYRDVLEVVGLKSNALYTAHYGADRHLSGNPDKEPISRGMPIDKARDSANLNRLCYERHCYPPHERSSATRTGAWIARLGIAEMVNSN